MSDITKCLGTNCPLKETCYRYTAKSNDYRQSYFGVPPIDEDGKCSHYWDNKEWQDDKHSTDPK